MNEKYVEVLQEYDLEVTTVRRGRGAWICETNDGLKLLREYKGTAKRLEFEDHILGEIQTYNNLLVDRYVRNKSGELISAAGDGNKFVVKNWFDDRECNLKDQDEIACAVKKIAVLHKLLRMVPFQEEWNMGSILVRPLAEEMERHNRELRRARTYISNKRKKTDFELCVIHNYSCFYEQAKEAQAGLEHLWKQGDNSLFLCHGDLNQHHILMGNYDVAMIEFNRMHLGIQMTDLYHFTRKVMEKHNWNLKLGETLLRSYEQVLPLDDRERAYLYYLFLYPEKYWKQINFYYNANKAWIPIRNIEKLMNLEEQQEKRKQFLDKIRL